MVANIATLSLNVIKILKACILLSLQRVRRHDYICTLANLTLLSELVFLGWKLTFQKLKWNVFGVPLQQLPNGI